MEYYVKSLIPIIESNYENFTTVEKNIADYFINNRSKEDLSARTIAQKLFVSEASLSRFAKKCGYRGYREFIYQYEKTFVEKQEAIPVQIRGVLNTYQELLNKTYSLLNEGQIVRICRYMKEAKKVCVCGRGSSGLAAREMEVRFMRTGLDIDSLLDSDLIRLGAIFQNPQNLVIGISLSGEREEVLYLLQTAHSRKAKTVLITEKDNGKFNEFCDEVVLIPSLKFLNYGNVISPQFPILMLLDILYSYYLEQDRNIVSHIHDGG
ncbi:MAG: MurR/RpiR family transcriptional regulator [Lachnospiraceae bacterium]|nr:MurR/RpiR family transcriptional regulator [Lachnospiraceae bacterium]